MHASRCVITVFAATGCLAAARAGDPGVVVDHQPAHVFGSASDTDFIDSFSGQRVWQMEADNILLDALATIRGIRWWGFYTEDNPPASETFRIRFYDARPADGLPGTILYEQNIANALRQPTGIRIPLGITPMEHVYQANLPVSFELAAQTPYWLEIVQLGDVDTTFRWETSAADLDGYRFLNPLVADWEAVVPDDLAFQLSTIPEPGTAVLFIIGVAFLSRSRRKGGVVADKR